MLKVELESQVCRPVSRSTGYLLRHRDGCNVSQIGIKDTSLSIRADSKENGVKPS